LENFVGGNIVCVFQCVDGPAALADPFDAREPGIPVERHDRQPMIRNQRIVHARGFIASVISSPVGVGVVVIGPA
jgi:hypothetical protein